MWERKKCDTERRNWSPVDVFMVLYGLLNLLSYCLSDYRQTALFGYVDRYMGLVTQLMLVCVYFLVSHFCVGERPFKGVFIVTGLVIVAYQMVEPVRGLLESWQFHSVDAVLTEENGVLQEAVREWFRKKDWKRRLLGEGPDCFGCVIYKKIDLSSQIIPGAQNEWMNLLVTGGLLGVFSFAGIFAGCFYEILRNWKRRSVCAEGAVVVLVYLVLGTYASQQFVVMAILFGMFGTIVGNCRRRSASEKSVSAKAKRLNKAEEEATAGLERALLLLQEISSEDALPRNTEEIEKVRHTGRRGRRMQRLAQVTVGLTAGAVLCLGYSVFLLVDLFGSEARSEAKMEALRELEGVRQAAVKESTEEVSTLIEEVAGNKAYEKEQESADEMLAGTDMAEYGEAYAPIFAQNEDMAAWLTIDGTRIDYPVMQTPEDENYYLYRDFYGKSDRAGCLILDTDSKPDGGGTDNLIVHGHNMKSGTMFGELDKYREEAYAKEHSRMKLVMKNEVQEYEVLAAFYSRVYLTTDITFKFYNFFEADTEEEFQYFYDNVKRLSLYDTGVEAELGDDFLTLSTCSYHTEDGRFVVVAKEVERKK